MQNRQPNRAVEWIDRGVPTLGANEQAEVYEDMRHNAGADVDFSLLILLAAGIAYFGLQQDSAVVIIGAMLVAPLMSPMMAMGFSIVNGDIPLFGRALASTLIGVALAVGMSAVITFVFPLKSVTDQILARTSPTILDLFVALISGMAGAYALGRKEVSASLPGVAIAASLVPPLCVVGFGIGSGNALIAGRSLLLFTTNLASIVVAGIAVFWLLGFRPDPSVDERVVRRAVRFAAGAVLVISIPLGYYTAVGAIETSREAEVARILADQVAPEVAEVEDIVIESVGEGFVIGATVYLYEVNAVDEAEQAASIEAIRNQLEAAVGRPVTLEARVIPAQLARFSRPGLDAGELDPASG